MTMPTRPPRKAINIMADPRVVRGSVAARQREHALRRQKELEAREAEERYRVEVVRNRLSLALADTPATGIPCEFGDGMERRSAAIRAETTARLAKLAGKTGRTAVAEWVQRQEQGPLENGIDHHSPRRPVAPRRLSPLRTKLSEHRVSPRLNGKIALSTPEEKQLNGFLAPLKPRRSHTNLKNVRFVPLREEIPPGGPHKVVPSIPRSSAGNGTFSRSGELQSRRDTVLPRRRFFATAPGTPPHSPYGPVRHTDASVQTDEAFDAAFDPIVKEMADTAIGDAIRSLRDEDDLRAMEEQNEKLLNIVVSEKRRNSELNLSILKHIRTEHHLEQDRQAALSKLRALDCHRLAASLVKQIVQNCTDNLANRGMIADPSEFRSVAIDTRQLEEEQRRLQAVTLEIQKDFFPYVYAKAEQMFVHKLADSYLKDALFSKNPKNRTEARARLNEQIQKYQKLMRGATHSRL